MTQTDFADPPARPEFATCWDCLQWEQVYGYIGVNDKLEPICYGCFWTRQVAARKRMGKDERPIEK